MMINGKYFVQDLDSDPQLHAENTMHRQIQEECPDKADRGIKGAKKRDMLLEALYCALRRRCEKLPPPGFDEWVSTRMLAEDCELGIYQTRSLLLKLVEQRRILVTPTLIANSLRWYVAQ